MVCGQVLEMESRRCYYSLIQACAVVYTMFTVTFQVLMMVVKAPGQCLGGGQGVNPQRLWHSSTV